MNILKTHLCRYGINGDKLGSIEELYECENGVWVYSGQELLPWQVDRIKKFNGIEDNGVVAVNGLSTAVIKLIATNLKSKY